MPLEKRSPHLKNEVSEVNPVTKVNPFKENCFLHWERKPDLNRSFGLPKESPDLP